MANNSGSGLCTLVSIIGGLVVVGILYSLLADAVINSPSIQHLLNIIGG